MNTQCSTLRREYGNTPHPNPLPQGERQAEWQGFRRRSSSYGGQVGATCGGAPIRFCETNPPFFDGIYIVNAYECMRYARNARGESVGSFWKTNPPGRVFGVVSGEKWVRFRKAKPVAPDDNGIWLGSVRLGLRRNEFEIGSCS